MSEQDNLAELREIVRQREIGAMQAAMNQEPRYIVMAFPVYPNGTTGDVVTDPEEASRIGQLMGIGDPTDPMGFAIWQVPEA